MLRVARVERDGIIDEFARAGTPVQTEPPDWADDRENASARRISWPDRP